MWKRNPASRRTAAFVARTLATPEFAALQVFEDITMRTPIPARDEALRAAEQEAVNAWTLLETVVAQTRSFEEQVRANEIALDGVRQEQEVGARTILDVLDAQQEVLNAQVSLVSSQTDSVVAEFRLLAAVGNLTAAYLSLPVDYYDPKAHYEAVRNKFIGTGPSVQ